MALEENVKQEIKDISSDVDCKREQWEKQKIIDLWNKLEWLNASQKRDDILESKRLLWEQKLWWSEQTLEDFLQKDIKSILEKKKAEWDASSNSSNTPESVQIFVNSIWKELQDLCWNKNDKVAILQVYLNSISDVNSKYANIPYDANRYNYKAWEEKRLFIDGILWPHTYNALRLATFGEELPKTEITRKQWYEFWREEPMIIWKDQPYIPLTLPRLDNNWNIESDKTIEIIDNPKIKWSIELLYLFYDWVSKKNNLSTDIDTEIINIMTDSKLYDNENQSANPLDWYIQAIKQLNIKIAWNNSDLKKWRDAITKFINGTETQQNAEISILNTLEYDVKSHEYVANYIASKYIDLSQDQYKYQMDNIKASTSDKDFSKYEKDIDKKWIEQKAVQKKFILETFNDAKKKATTPELQQELCQMFEVDYVSEVTPALIWQKAEVAIKLAEDEFKDSMFDNYFNKRFLEEKIRSDKASLDWMGNYSWKDKLTALFADIQWIWYLNPSSENLETAKFIGQMIAEEAACFAIWALTAWAWWILLKAALYWKRAMKIARLAKAVSRWARVSKFNQVKNLIRTVNMAEKWVRAERAATRWGRAINAGTTILGVSIQWAAFYEGTNTMQNIIKWVPMFQWWNDYPEITKSIAMFGAFKIVNSLVATQKLVTVAWKQFNANPFNKLLQIQNWDKVITKGMKIAWESLVWWWAIFAVEWVWEMIIDTDHDWTKEEFIQSVLMYMIFRWAWEVGKLRLWKNKKTGKPEIQKENPKQLTAPKEQKQITTKSEPKQLTEGKNNLNTEKAKTENNVTKKSESTKTETKLENQNNKNLEINKINDDISLLQREIQLQQNELNSAKLALNNISNRWKPRLEKTLKDNVFLRQQDIKFKQAELDKLILKRKMFTS